MKLLTDGNSTDMRPVFISSRCAWSWGETTFSSLGVIRLKAGTLANNDQLLFSQAGIKRPESVILLRWLLMWSGHLKKWRMSPVHQICALEAQSAFVDFAGHCSPAGSSGCHIGHSPLLSM
ncbi:hypothetical protein CEXT_348371 [Caerostris extrusa]|uniref:Uncharacterized protein n=1 Tax=Caerostris extrusa TaxID=172846 RepID=A0AAV4PM19_CAEEX|nr:hypothetical protein CEXT_348371 [Caerostris extrusa]